jgi:hypothetical protein
MPVASRLTNPGEAGPATCKGTASITSRSCNRMATETVTFRTRIDTGIAGLDSIDTEVVMCEMHAKRLRVGTKAGRQTVVSKAIL